MSTEKGVMGSGLVSVAGWSVVRLETAGLGPQTGKGLDLFQVGRKLSGGSGVGKYCDLIHGGTQCPPVTVVQVRGGGGLDWSGGREEG